MKIIRFTSTFLVSATLLVAGCSAQNDSNLTSSQYYGGSSISLAHSYETLQELEEGSVLIAELKINDIHSVDEKIDSTYYSATVIDVLKGKIDKDEIIVKQIGIELEEEISGEMIVERENPLMKPGNTFILFLKKGQRYEDLYYVAGEYQGKFEVEDHLVYSTQKDSNYNTKIQGEDVEEFKNRIRELVKNSNTSEVSSSVYE